MYGQTIQDPVTICEILIILPNLAESSILLKLKTIESDYSMLF